LLAFYAITLVLAISKGAEAHVITNPATIAEQNYSHNPSDAIPRLIRVCFI